ncbi:hypothetical protein [Pseudomonas sp. RW3S2]|uniref:hypothetical protein n=1 Tax=Pseudomonas sp. RW3S2 TaxID=485884 RepID=UPI0016485E07|nr:hypothetical protein [Pseudomonas sp. RW3S2]MBC3422754.1 hypothetical protein [Pseudomonas sp. RW3S2]
MLKIVPDPPFSPENPHALEDLVLQIIEHLTCALAITHHSTALTLGTPAQPLTIATAHEVDAALRLAETALSRIQVRH